MAMTNNSWERHVATFVFPFTSHPSIILSLVHKLAAAAPNVKFSYFSTAKSNSLIFSSMPESHRLDNLKAYDVGDGFPEGFVPSDKFGEESDLFYKAVPENFRRGVEVAVAETGRRISCLVADAFLPFAGEMADEMQVPLIVPWIAGACSLSLHLHTELIRQTFGINGIAGREDETLKFIPGLSTLRIRDMPERIFFGNLESLFSRMLHNMRIMLRRATVVTINSFEELEPIVTNDIKSKFQNLLDVGPSTLSWPPPSNSDAHSCLLWLDKHKVSSVAYISFGTLVSPPPNELVALAEALEASGVPFLWSLKENLKTHLPIGFLERMSINGKVVPWAPQLQILAHTSIGVFVTHCGWNSVLDSIAGGVPMIGRPVFADNMVNQWMVEEVLGIGVKVEGGVFTKSGMMRALELILLHEEGKKMKEKIGVLKELAIKAVGSNGSSIENLKTLLQVVTAIKDT